MTIITPHTRETSDLYEAAYLSLNGFDLVELHVHGTGRHQAVFTFGGEHQPMRTAANAYFGGEALVNLCEYRTHLERLKDRMFRTLRASREQKGGRS